MVQMTVSLLDELNNDVLLEILDAAERKALWQLSRD